MWSSGWGWPLAASAAAFTLCTAASVALFPPLHRRYKHPEIAKRIPLSSYLAFDLSVRFRAYLHSKGGVSSKLTKLPDVETLAPGVIRILGKNPGRMTLQGTNTYLLGHGPKRVLLDSSDGNLTYIENLMRVCEAHGVEEITDLIITHGHSDHIGGVLHLREACPHIRMWKYMPSGGADRTLRYTNAECEALLIQPLTSTKCFDVPGMDAVLRTEYMPGHCADHSCFLLEDRASGTLSLFSGDCILGEGSCVFESLKDLMHSLVRLRALVPSIIYPAHGPVVEDAGAKIEEYITHRMQREQEVIQVLKVASSHMSAKQIVSTIYKDLPFVLQLAARKAIQKHLEKLIHDKRVREIATSSWFSSPTYELIGA